jgi:hypothetical protein
MARRKRSDSIEAQVEAMRRVLDGAPMPPDYCAILPEHMPFWKAIMETKDYDMWTPNDLILAASLARMQHDIQVYSKIVQEEGRTDANGKPSAAHKVLHDLNIQQLAMARMLQIHSLATQGTSKELSKKNKTFMQSKQKAKELTNVASLIKRA